MCRLALGYRYDLLDIALISIALLALDIALAIALSALAISISLDITIDDFAIDLGTDLLLDLRLVVPRSSMIRRTSALIFKYMWSNNDARAPFLWSLHPK